ncbi:MAG: hypothetical protein ABFS32_15750 [Bacteroidota bacterium]
MTRFLIGILIFIGADLFAQEKQNFNDGRDSFSIYASSKGNDLMAFEAYAGIKGTPFLVDTWSIGSIVLKNGDVFDNLRLKYDMNEDNVLVWDKTDKKIFPSRNITKSFNFTDSTGVSHFFINISEKEYKFEIGIDFGFFELLYNGKTKLLAKRKKYLHHVEPKGGYSDNKSYDEFRSESPKYYWVDNKGKLFELKKGKKNILNLLKDDGSLEAYIKKEKIKLNKEQDIVQLIQHYDTEYLK